MILIGLDCILRRMRRKRAALIVPIIILLAAAIAAAVYFTRPSFAVVLPPHPEPYRLGEPTFTLSYRETGNPASADAVFVMPGAGIPATGGYVYLMRPAADGEEYDGIIDIDEAEMWKTALGDGRECIVFESSDADASAIAAALMEADGNAFTAVYDGRVTDANIGMVLRSAEGADSILLLTPSTSAMLLRGGRPGVPAILDFRDAAALTAGRCDGIVTIGWDALIRSALAGDPGLAYAFIPR